jgi:hypothetical protein
VSRPADRDKPELTSKQARKKSLSLWKFLGVQDKAWTVLGGAKIPGALSQNFASKIDFTFGFDFWRPL